MPCENRHWLKPQSYKSKNSEDCWQPPETTRRQRIFPQIFWRDCGFAERLSQVAQWSRIQLQCRRCRFDPWVGKISWRRKWQPSPVFLSGRFHAQRSLEGFSPGGHRVGHDWAGAHSLALPTPWFWFWTCSLQNHERINVVLSHLVCGIVICYGRARKLIHMACELYPNKGVLFCSVF